MKNRPRSPIRLAGLPLSLTLLSILAGSLINRVMVVELGLPVILAGLFLAIPLLISPERVWLGHLSDAYPLQGLRREPYLILGALLSGVGVALSVALVVDTPAPISTGAGLILLGLLLYGVGRNLVGNTFQALLTDRFPPGVARSRAANLYEVVKILGLAAASLLPQAVELTNARSAGLLLGVWGLAFQLGRALANLLGAALVDLVGLIAHGAPLLAYGTAFAVEGALLGATLLVFGRLHVRAARALTRV